MAIVCMCGLQESESFDMHVDTVSSEITLVAKGQSNWNMLQTDITA